MHLEFVVGRSGGCSRQNVEGSMFWQVAQSFSPNKARPVGAFDKRTFE